MVQVVTDKDFELETNEGISITDFWAPWCGPCRMQSPVLEELDTEIGDQVKIVKMDVDQNQTVPASFGIMSIPTLLVKKDGEVVEKLIGYHGKEQIEEIIAKYK
ncbi:thioredoxin [Carnobacterium iners]|uniref:Thioredoxin n=1 Tax=Carnobacterium iners TaxID=1073423 RepID=A0A1X7NTR8_9LACT|nr:thioredoxin [Carnobacterium iners]SEK88883.1 thioredoxin [Carnobacterium iners]SMH40809.1 thioredoxin [Carnobacterium iners]